MSLLPLVTKAMEAFAPLSLAEQSWDNVGVLVDNPAPCGSRAVFLTIDLTERTLEEALQRHKAEVIISYHPPIFSPLKYLRQNIPKQQIILRTIVAGASIYSPHTALDACHGGINDWILDCCGDIRARKPITPTVDDPSLGAGRVGVLASEMPVTDLVARLKKAFGVPTARVSLPRGWTPESRVGKVAVCAGSGASLFRAIRPSDGVQLLISGEMGHHDVLAANDKNQAVILFEHTNTERGYLKERLLPYLRESLPSDVNVVVSETDADPLIIW